MKLISLPIDYSIELENMILLSGSSLIYDEEFSTAYNFNTFSPRKELLEEEVALRLKRISIDDNSDIELAFINKPEISGYIFDSVSPFNLMHPNNWFHFLIESLPSLLEGIINGKINKNTIIISGKMHINMFQAIQTLFGSQLNILQLDAMKAVVATKIVYIKKSYICHELQSGEVNTQYYFNENNLHILKSIFENKLNFKKNFTEGCKVFVLRKSFQRNVINIDQLILSAESKGYIIVNPEELSFNDQVILFSSAEKIIGPTGAWLANLLFVNDRSNITVLNPETIFCENSIWKTLGEIIGLKVLDIFCEVKEKNIYQPIHSDFHVDIKKFNQLL